jgi:hypothetical protein
VRYALLALLLIACSRDAARHDTTVAAGGGRGVAAVSTTSTTQLSCGVTSATMATDTGIGELQVGRQPQDIHRLCRVLRDTTRLGPEAMPERALTVLTSRDTFDVTINDDRVWRIAVDRPAIHTADSLGVGSTLAKLLRVSGASGSEGEGVLYVMLPTHCGMSFRLKIELSANQHRDHWSESDLRKLPSALVIDQILITGCGKDKP